MSCRKGFDGIMGNVCRVGALLAMIGMRLLRCNDGEDGGCGGGCANAPRAWPGLPANQEIVVPESNRFVRRGDT